MQRPVFILGMHRSGTSCLAGCLEDAGLVLGDVNRAAPFNKKGNNENRDVMDLNDAVLARANAAWDRIPVHDIVWNDEELDRLDDLLKSYPDDRVWGLKDPRVLLTLSGWQSRVSPRYVGTFRHPAEVISSLVVRAQAWKSPMCETEAEQLWIGYNARMLAQYQKDPFPIVRFDVDTAEYTENVRRIARQFGLAQPDAIVFLDPTLRHQHARPDVSDRCKPIWEKLNEVAL